MVNQSVKAISAKIALIVVACLLLLTGLFVEQIKVFVGSLVVTQWFVVFLAVLTTVLIFVEISVRKNGRWTRVREYDNTQLVSLVVAVLVLASSVLWLLFPSTTFLVGALKSTFIVQGVTLFLEAVR